MVLIQKMSAYLRLMRFHKPVGIVLLWAPTAWALWAVNHGAPTLRIFLCFFFGTVCMRAAGCIINDVADRHIDKHVKRTAMRPVTSGEISVLEALVLFVLLLCLAGFIVMQLPLACFNYALGALAVTILYPFCKRFFEAPQLILGVAFSMGIPMAYAASGIAPNATMLLLCVLNFIWIVAYDTEYAMVDKDDDQRIGVRSTAVWFATHCRIIILLLQILFHSMWLAMAFARHDTALFYVVWAFAGVVLVYQQVMIGHQNRAAYLKAFSSNAVYGLLMWLALATQTT